MKNYFTKQQIEQLKVFEHHFYTAVYENYKRASAASDNDYVADLFEKVTGGKLNRNWSCGTCVLNAYKAVGKLYYESIKYWEEQDLAARKYEEQNAAQTETEPVAPKATRGKKVANKGKKGSKK